MASGYVDNNIYAKRLLSLQPSVRVTNIRLIISIFKSITRFNCKTQHVFCDYDWAIILIFAVLELGLWLSLLHMVVNWKLFAINIRCFITKILF